MNGIVFNITGYRNFLIGEKWIEKDEIPMGKCEKQFSYQLTGRISRQNRN
jgi:hypothetical protein